MLYIKIDENNKLKYHCKLCLDEYELDSLEGSNKECVYKQDYNFENNSFDSYVKSSTIYEDKTLPYLTNMKCVNAQCPTHEGTPKKVKYIKYNKDEMKFIYFCCVCESKWTSSNDKLE
tara:strand:- start:24 stop:377 length:354 start_codon:yes stop_codon:yes gene_type:complete